MSKISNKKTITRTSAFAALAVIGLTLAMANTANAEVVLGDDFTGHSWSGLNVTVGGGAWDTESGLSASATIGFDHGQKATSVAGVINPDSRVPSDADGWTATISFTTGAAAIDLSSIDLGYHLLDGAGNPQPFATFKKGSTVVTFDNGVAGGSIIGQGYTAVPGDTDVTIDRSIDLTGSTLAANTLYTMTINSFALVGDSDNHFKALDYLELNGTIASAPVPTPAALPAGLMVLGVMAARRRRS